MSPVAVIRGPPVLAAAAKTARAGGGLVGSEITQRNAKIRRWCPRTLIRIRYLACRGDPALFMRGDMVEQGRRIVQPVLDAWAACGKDECPGYEAGSDGGHAAVELLANERPVKA